MADLKPEGCTVEKTKDGIRLKMTRKKESWAKTPREYPVPFRATFVAKTNSTNIRLSYGRARVIFNWEANRGELRVHDPKSGSPKGYKGKGKVATDTWHHIVLEIREKSMRVILNDQILHERNGDYEKLKAKIGIGSAHGSVVEVKGLGVEQL